MTVHIYSHNKAREKVMTYINHIPIIDVEPLCFIDSDYIEITEVKKDANDCKTNSKVLDVILVAKKYFSSRNTTTGHIETHPNKHRSVLDIWRHFKYFNPEITIFEVMDLMYKNKKYLPRQFCYAVRRRVFDFSVTRDFRYISDDNHKDEFGLYFIDWNNIQKNSIIPNIYLGQLNFDFKHNVQYF
jgi:hypothetical protein